MKTQKPKLNTKDTILKILKPKTKNQAEAIRTIAENMITILLGPSGCGKTKIACWNACEALSMGKVDKIIITRPIVEAGQKLGYLPGSYIEKVQVYLTPIFEHLYDCIGKQKTEEYLRTEVIEIVPLAYMRGRNLRGYIIADEMQNATMQEIKLLLTRITDETSKLVLTGDLKQTDLYPDQQGALEICAKNLVSIQGIGVTSLHVQDIVRHPLIGKILEKLP
jgi:phosphate starvation-inducible PhoH-like protein